MSYSVTILAMPEGEARFAICLTARADLNCGGEVLLFLQHPLDNILLGRGCHKLADELTDS